MPWQAGETSSGQGERVVFLTTPCITLEAFVETKVGPHAVLLLWWGNGGDGAGLVIPKAFDPVYIYHLFEAFVDACQYFGVACRLVP